MAEYLQFKRGQLAGLKGTEITPGTVYITTDERAMYVDYTDGATPRRMRLGDYVEYATLAELTATASEHLSTTALYFVADGNMLLRYTGNSQDGYSGFVQINPDTKTKISAVEMSATNDAANNQVTVVTKVTDNITNNPVESKPLTIKGSTGATVSAAGDVITIDVSSINESSHYTPAYDDVVDFKATDTTHNVLVESNATNDTVASKKKVRFVSGVNVDSNGHVVGLGYDTIADTHAGINSTVLEVATNVAGDGVVLSNDVITTDNTGAGSLGTMEIVGEGSTTVSAASNGKIAISSTDSKVTSVENHYKPANGTALNIASDGNMAATEVNAVTGIKTDAAGHITEATYTTLKNTHAHPNATTMEVTAGTNAADIGVIVADTDGNENATINTMKIVGAGAATVSADGTTVTITSADTKVTSAENHYTPTYAADATKTKNSTLPTVNAEVEVVVGVELDAKGHTTGVKTQAIKDTHATLEDITLVAESQGFKATMVYDGLDKESNVLDPIVKIGATEQSIHFVNGVADLDVYTTTEVDNLITSRLEAANAMTFIGSLDVNAAAENDGLKKALPTENVNAGDTWIVASAGIYGGKAAQVGDLFIALTDKATGSNDTNWAYVPSGNDTMPELSGEDNKIQLGFGGAPDQLGAIEVKGAENCGIVTDVTNNVMTIGFEWGTF